MPKTIPLPPPLVLMPSTPCSATRDHSWKQASKHPIPGHRKSRLGLPTELRWQGEEGRYRCSARDKTPENKAPNPLLPLHPKTVTEALSGPETKAGNHRCVIHECHTTGESQQAPGHPKHTRAWQCTVMPHTRRKWPANTHDSTGDLQGDPKVLQQMHAAG